MQDVKYLTDTTSVPDRSDYYSSLKGETISESEYKDVCEFWEAFDVENMKEYAMIYCVLDTLLVSFIHFPLCYNSLAYTF